MNYHLEECTKGLLPALDGTKEAQAAATSMVEEMLACTYPAANGKKCGWFANWGRIRPRSARGVLESLPDWVEAMHCHFMHHVFWSRFPYSKRFFPKLGEKVEREELFESVYGRSRREGIEFLDGDRLVVEIEYPPETEP